MKRNILILLTLIALPLTGMAQDKDNSFTTGGLVNGRGWLAMSHDRRLGYLNGYREHDRITDERLGKITPAGDDGALYGNCAAANIAGMPRLTDAETAKALDAFFAEQANVNIPVSDAIAILNFKVGGSTDYTIQSMTEMSRRQAVRKAK